MMITFLNAVIVIAGSLMLLMSVGMFLFVVLIAIAEWRDVCADADAERDGEGIVRGAVAHSMGKP